MVRAVTFDAAETLIHFGMFPPDRYFAALCRLADIELSDMAGLEGARARKRFQEAQRPSKTSPMTTDWLRARHAPPDSGAPESRGTWRPRLSASAMVYPSSRGTGSWTRTYPPS